MGRNLEVLNLMPEIGAGTLSGVNHACPEDSQGNLKGVGAKNEYHCGAEIGDGLYEYCKGASGSANTDVQCAGVPAESVQCLEECGDWWYQCANGAAFVKPVPFGTKCKGDAFVVEAVCAASASTVAPSSSSTPSSVSQSTTAAPAASSTAAPAPTECGSCSGCLASNGVCYPESKDFCDIYPQYTWCGTGASSSTVAPSSALSTTPAPSTEAPTTASPSTEAPSSASSTTPAPSTEAPTTAAPLTEAPSSASSTTPVPSTEAPTTAAPSTDAPTTAAPIAQCGLCNGCLADNGVCYPESKGFCDLYPQYTWCGARRLSGNLRR